MPPRFRSPAVDKAESFLLGAVRTGSVPKREVLPRVAELAKAAGVSPVSMSRALARLKKSGILSGSPGHASVVEQTLPRPETPLPPVSWATPMEQVTGGWERLADRIEGDILAGAFAHGATLPSMKECSYRYCVNYRTLRKALTALVERRILEPRHRGYAVAPVRARRKFARIVLLGYGFGGTKPVFGQNTEEFLHSIDTGCGAADVVLHQQSYWLADKTLSLGDPRTERVRSELNDDDTVLGYVVFVIDQLCVIPELFHALLHTHKPVAILDRYPQWDLPPRCAASPHFKRFVLTPDRRSGADVGRFLLVNRHRHVAFFSPFHGAQWSKERLAGISGAFESKGDAHPITTYTVNDRRIDWEYAADAGAAVDLGALRRLLKRLRSEAPEPFLRTLDTLGIETNLDFVAGDCAIGCRFEEFFVDAYRNQSITAWVTANDLVGIMAHNFLVRQNTGRSIALVSFDNNRNARLYGVTSYSSNFTGAVNAMLAFILRPVTLGRFRKLKTIPIPGVLVERGSSSPPA